MLYYKKLIYLFLFCILLSACNKTENNIVQTNNVQSDDVSFMTDVELPDWIGNYFTLGTYNERIRLANTSNYSNIQLENNIIIPESTLLSILFNTPLKETFLYKDSKENIICFINELENLTIIKEDEQSYNNKFIKSNKLRLIETNIFLINAESNYIGINILTDKENHHLITIHQDNNILYASSTSERFSQLILNMTDTKSFNISDINNITKIEYLNDQKWLSCTTDYVNMFKAGLFDGKPIGNFTTGCPFELILKATLNDGRQYNMKYSTDTCGILIIEDSTFEIDKSYKDLLRTPY